MSTFVLLHTLSFQIRVQPPSGQLYIFYSASANVWKVNMPLTSPQACGVDFEIRAFCAKSIEEKIHKRWAQQRHVWCKCVGACAMSERLKCVCGCVCVGTQFAWWSGRFSTLRRNLVHNQWWRQPAASSCLTGHCTWRPRWTRRCTHTHTHTPTLLQ